MEAEDAELAAQARRDFEDDLGQSVRIRYEDWKKRSLIQRIREWMSYFLLARLDIFFARAELERWKRRKVRR